MTIQKSKPEKAELRKFAYVFGGIVSLLFGLVIPLLAHKPFSLWPWYIAAISLIWGTIHPLSLWPIYIAWMKFGAIAGWINTRIILAIVFYLVIFPIGLLKRLTGKDSMARKYEKNISSYRINSEKRKSESMERPF